MEHLLQRIGSAEQVAASFGAEESLPDSAISALQSHPHFQQAVRVAISGLIEMYGRNRLLNRVMNDRGRLVGGMIALYLHVCAAPGSKGAGLTAARFQAFCQDLKVCSPGRAWALLALLRLEGYLVPGPGVPDRRQRRLVPTKRLIEFQQQQLKCQFEAMALLMPAGRLALEVHGRPEFMAALMRHLGALSRRASSSVLRARPGETRREQCRPARHLESFPLGSGRRGARRHSCAGLDVRAVRAVWHSPRPCTEAACERGRDWTGEADRRRQDGGCAASPRSRRKQLLCGSLRAPGALCGSCCGGDREHIVD